VHKRVEISGASDDQRAKRTREQLSWALVDLIREKDYDAITVQDIAGRAHVGRSTFYAHFADKEDLFVQHSVAFNQAFAQHLAWDERLRSWRFPVRGLFEHMQEFRFLYEALAKSRKLDRILKVGQIVMAQAFELRIASTRSDLSAVPAAILAQHLAATLTNLLTWWMDRHCPHSAREMDEYFHRLVAGIH
jgi:AcrR family transcriptional regulator